MKNAGFALTKWERLHAADVALQAIEREYEAVRLRYRVRLADDAEFLAIRGRRDAALAAWHAIAESLRVAS